MVFGPQSALTYIKMITAGISVFMFSLICSVNCDNVTPQNILEAQTLLLLDKWRMGCLNSDVMPLPSLKSIKIPHVQHTYDRKGIKMTYALEKMELTGLDSFLVEMLNISETKKNLEMSILIDIPKLTLHAEKYEIKGRAYYLYPLKGSGDMTVIFRDSNIIFKLNFVQDGTSTRVKEFLLDFNVSKIEANLVNSSWPINNVLNSDGVEILASYHDDIAKALWEYTVPYVDQHLVNVTTAQIVNTILNLSLKN